MSDKTILDVIDNMSEEKRSAVMYILSEMFPLDVKHSDSITHYGVVGMKWGKSRVSRLEKKANDTVNNYIEKASNIQGDMAGLYEEYNDELNDDESSGSSKRQSAMLRLKDAVFKMKIGILNDKMTLAYYGSVIKFNRINTKINKINQKHADKYKKEMDKLNKNPEKNKEKIDAMRKERG